jgi:aryl-alcohol dehydrogenase-like predicted oxidoreductase
VEEPWTARPLIASGRFDVVQMRYNVIYQSAALHALDEAIGADLGVAVMRPMTSGILQRIARHLAPQWSESDIYKVCLEFVLSDSRVHVANMGMRWAAVRAICQIGGDEAHPAVEFMVRALPTASEVDGYNMMVYLALPVHRPRSGSPWRRARRRPCRRSA